MATGNVILLHRGARSEALLINRHVPLVGHSLPWFIIMLWPACREFDINPHHCFDICVFVLSKMANCFSHETLINDQINHVLGENAEKRSDMFLGLGQRARLGYTWNTQRGSPLSFLLSLCLNSAGRFFYKQLMSGMEAYTVVYIMYMVISLTLMYTFQRSRFVLCACCVYGGHIDFIYMTSVPYSMKHSLSSSAFKYNHS